jgi:F-type H+-transporting ATPase subunit gamma
MMDLERARSRLDNIRSVQPILGALHSISLGSWQAALNQSGRVRRYAEQLIDVLPPLLPHLPTGRSANRFASSSLAADDGGTHGVALVVGSERGLCGRFNAAAVERAEAFVTDQVEAGASVELAGLGTRVCRLLQRRGRELAWSGSLSITALPSFDLAFGLTRDWLARYEARQLDALDVIHNAYRGPGRYEPTVTRLIPPQLPSSTIANSDGGPLTIIETDPLSLYVCVIEQWTAVSLYGMLLDSAAAEHAARYALMEAATQNTEQLIAELTLAIQTARQQAITREMQELAAGAGMVG